MAETTKKTASVPQFSIEADTPRNGDLMLASITGERLRGRIESNKTVTDRNSGQKMTPIDQAAGLATLPMVPGMILKVNPAELSYQIVDPLNQDESKLETVNRGLVAKGLQPVQGVPNKEGTLDKDRMKTLCREIYYVLQADEARWVSGPKYTIDDCDALPGEYLLNPGSQVPNSQPRYEKDFEAWKDSLNR